MHPIAVELVMPRLADWEAGRWAGGEPVRGPQRN